MLLELTRHINSILSLLVVFTVIDTAVSSMPDTRVRSVCLCLYEKKVCVCAC